MPKGTTTLSRHILFLSMGKIIDLTGHKFGRLTVIKFDCVDKRGTMWLCKCSCGKEIIVAAGKLRSGHTKSCGCYAKEVAVISNTTHGLRNHRLYRIWNSMKQRCNNPNIHSYKHYGGRNIKVYEEWFNDFQSFYNWSMANGYQDGLTLDRIDVNGNYEPNNCRWTTYKKQNNNRRNNTLITFNGETHTLAEWREIKGLSQSTLFHRIERGWDIEKMLTTPQAIMSKKRKVKQYDVKMNFLKEWESARKAERTLGIRHIGECCKDKQKTAGGYIWRYRED